MCPPPQINECIGNPAGKGNLLVSAFCDKITAFLQLAFADNLPFVQDIEIFPET